MLSRSSRRTPRPHRQSGVDAGVGEVIGRIRLEVHRGHDPALAETGGDLIGDVAAGQKGVEEPEAPFEGSRRSREAARGERGGRDRRVRSPSAVEPLHASAGAVRLDDAARHARRDSHGIADDLRVAAHELRDRTGGTDGAAHGGGVLAPVEIDRIAPRPVVAGHPDPYADLYACRDRGEKGPAVRAAHLCGRETSGDDRGARMEHRRQVGVVVVERVGERAVDESRKCRRHGGVDPDGVSLATTALCDCVVRDRLARVQLGSRQADSEGVEEIGVGRLEGLIWKTVGRGGEDRSRERLEESRHLRRRHRGHVGPRAATSSIRARRARSRRCPPRGPCR